MRPRRPSTMSLKLMAMVVVRKKMENVMMGCVAMDEGEKKEDKSVIIFVGRSCGD